MTRLAFTCLAAVSAVAFTAATPSAAAHAAATNDMSRAVVKEVVRDTSLPYPARCYTGHRASSSPGWAYLMYAAPPPRGCPPGEGAWVVAKHRSGGWHEVGITLLVVPCRDLRVDLAGAKAPVSVFRDFRAAGVCMPD